LFNAIEKNWPDAARLLVERGADINVKDGLSRRPLHEAAQLSRSDLAELLLAQGTDVNTVDSNGLTPLHAVAQRGCLKTGELLITNGAKVDATDIAGRTPLHLAAQRGDIRLVKLLLANGANPNVRDRNERTPLHDAATAGNWGPVQLLLSKNADINAQDVNGLTALHMAAETGHDRMVKLLIERGAIPLLLNNDQVSALHLAKTQNRATKAAAILRPFSVAALAQALETGNIDEVKSLLDDCPELVKTSVNHVTPLHIAAQKGYKDIAELLLARGANVAAMGWTEQKKTPLHAAAANGHLEVAKLLLLMGADPNAKDSQGKTPLDAAQIEQHPDVAEWIASKGGEAGTQEETGVETGNAPEQITAVPEPTTDPFETIQLGETRAEFKGRLRALTYNELLASIIVDNRKRVTEIVRENPLLVNADFLGISPLYLAVSKDKKDIAELLITNGANIETFSDRTQGRTPLHEAVRQGHEDMVKMLLDHGANPFAQDHSEKTPLDIAKENNRIEIAKILQADMGIQ